MTYQGEELGMTNTNISWEDTLDPSGLACGPDRYQECSRDPERTPMQWNTEANAGFSNAERTWLPVNPNYKWLNVEAQLTIEDPHNSHLGVYKDTMRVRNSGRNQTLFYDIGNTFVALNEMWVLLLNFEESVQILNLSDLLWFPPWMAVVSARSVNGTEENKVGEIKWLFEDLVLGSYEAIILRLYGASAV